MGINDFKLTLNEMLRISDIIPSWTEISSANSDRYMGVLKGIRMCVKKDHPSISTKKYSIYAEKDFSQIGDESCIVSSVKGDFKQKEGDTRIMDLYERVKHLPKLSKEDIKKIAYEEAKEILSEL